MIMTTSGEYRDRLEAGVCALNGCGQPARPGRVFCAGCAARQRLRPALCRRPDHGAAPPARPQNDWPRRNSATGPRDGPSAMTTQATMTARMHRDALVVGELIWGCNRRSAAARIAHAKRQCREGTRSEHILDTLQQGAYAAIPDLLRQHDLAELIGNAIEIARLNELVGPVTRICAGGDGEDTYGDEAYGDDMR